MKMLALFLPAVILISGCRTTVNRTDCAENRPRDAGNELEIRKIGDRILNAIEKEDYREFSSAAGKEMDLSEEDFLASERNIRKQFGKMTGYTYLTDLELPLLSGMVWKVRFEREGENRKTIRQELLFRLITGKINGKSQVVGMSFL